MFEGLMPVPDSTFVRKLKQFDPKLECRFSRRHGRFIVTQPRVTKPERPAEVWMINGDSGEFRQPDSRDLKILFGGDLHRISVEERERKAIAYMKGYKKKQKKNVKDEIRNRTKDGVIQLKKMYYKTGNLGKAPAPFRKIERKPKGKVFK